MTYEQIHRATTKDIPSLEKALWRYTRQYSIEGRMTRKGTEALHKMEFIMDVLEALKKVDAMSAERLATEKLAMEQESPFENTDATFVRYNAIVAKLKEVAA